MQVRNHTRGDDALYKGDTVEIFNAEDHQQNGIYTLASITSDDEQEFDLTLVSQSCPGFITTIVLTGDASEPGSAIQ